LSHRQIAERVYFAQALVAEQTKQLLTLHWTPEGITKIDGTDGLGHPLPNFAYKAMEKLNWFAPKIAGVHTSSRIGRMAEEAAGRALRAGAKRAKVVESLLSSYPWETTEEKKKLWAALPIGTSGVWVRNLKRRIQKYERVNGHLPGHLCDMETEGQHGEGLLLAVTDCQYVETEREKRGLFLHILLPTCVRPTKAEWNWHTLYIVVPEYADFASAIFCLPTLLVQQGKLQIDLPLQRERPQIVTTHKRCFGVDWGLNRLLTGFVSEMDKRGLGKPEIFTDGRFYQFNVFGLHARYQQVRRHLEKVRAKQSQYKRILSGEPDEVTRRDLEEKLAMTKRLILYLSSKMTNLNKETARLCALWTVDQAKALGCTLIAFEDLTAMEARGLGPTINGRLSPQVRGMLLTLIQDYAAKAGIEVRLVKPWGTSAGCPRCIKKISHVKSSRATSKVGYHWAFCKHCGYQGDRDHAASQRIGMRGLLGTGNKNENHSSFDQIVRVRRTKRSTRQHLPTISASKIPHHRAKLTAPLNLSISINAMTNSLIACRLDSPDGHKARYRSPGQGNAGGKSAQPLYNSTWCPLDGTRYALRHKATISPVRWRQLPKATAITLPLIFVEECTG
jgi:hypothetical protein